MIMQFLDLNTGYTFDALWQDGQVNGYTFWFPNEQSIRLTYTMPICIYTESSSPIELEIEENPIFSFITHSVEDTEYGGFMFKEPVYSFNTLTSVENINNKYYHKFYVACKSDEAKEFTAFINIKGHGRIKIGADFYGEYEPVYINLSNMGVEIPEYIQKALYDSNVHEDFKDDILLNRKFKELLSGYFDILANKGSYKSLLNSLSWFEWGDILRIREIWKRTSTGRTIYDDREMRSLLENKYNDLLGNFVKTSYAALYANLYRISDNYNEEYNPILEAVALKWGKDELALKMSLLSQFFATFFMPIHMSLLHACVEDIVYTNTVKSVEGNIINRVDMFGDWNYVYSNIDDNNEFKITNVNAQVTDDTIFATDFNNTDITIGVDLFPSNSKIDETNIKNFSSQYYAGPGAIIPIEFTIPNQTPRDFIKYTSIDFIPDGLKERKKFIFNDRIYTRNGKITIKFNLLVKESRDYIIDFMFITGSSKTFTKQIKIKVTDADNLSINIYKVQAKDDKNGFTLKDWNNMEYNDYFFRIQPNNSDAKQYYSQYLPYMSSNNILYDKHKGIKLNRTIVVDMRQKNGLGEKYDDAEIAYLRSFMDDDFIELDRREIIYDNEGNIVLNEDGSIKYGPITYTIWISKKFNTKTPEKLYNNEINIKYNVIRDSLSFYPQFHNIVPLNGNNLSDYTINQYEALCCAAEINDGKNIIPFRYGHLIEDAEWTFENSTTLKPFEHTASVRQPFIASNKNYEELPDGYYDVVFKYKLVDTEQRELRLSSAFRKKSI